MPAYEFNLNVDPGGMPPVIHLAQYDTGRTYYANLKQGGEYYYLGLGATAKIKGRNARGVCWELDCTVNTSLTYQVQFTPEGAATDQFGIMPVQMELTDGQGVISTLLMVWDIQRAGYTSEEAVTSPEFETALEAAVAAAIAQQGLGFTEEFKQALLACLNNVAWATPDGQSLVNDLEDALYPEVHLTSITAAYDQDRPIYPDSTMTDIKYDLVVTAHYSDGTDEVLSDSGYTLSGTLEAGTTSTLTVTYEGKTAEIEVLVKLLPSAYQQVEYIESSGTQALLLTDKIAETENSKIKIEIEAIFYSQTGTGIAACMNSSAGMWFGSMSNGTQAGVGGGIYFSGLDVGEKHKYTIDWTNSGATERVVCDDSATITRSVTFGQTNKPVCLFGECLPGATTLFQLGIAATMYTAKMWYSGNLYRNLIPCYRKSDSEVGMYDLVSGTFLENANTGSFTKGADV